MAGPLSILNPHPELLPGPQLLHDLLAPHLHRDTIAIDFEDGDRNRQLLSYAELHTRSDALASRLEPYRQECSARASTRFIVPLYIPQSPDHYVAQLAVLKAGGAFCPITLDVPEDRLRFILQDVDARIIITASSVSGQLPSLDGVAQLTVGETGSRGSPTRSDALIRPSHAAYIMYTSGSTGTPKGVVISHLAATQALLAHDCHIPAFKRFLQFASPTFDVSIFEIFFPLFRGATLVACDRTQLLNDLPSIINRLDVDAAELTPSVANSLLRERAGVPGLKVLLTIGEMLQKSVVEQFGGDADQVGILHGMYGPTEATIHCTLQTAFEKAMPVGNIGVPLPTVSAFIVRPAASTVGDAPEIVAIGKEGELAVGGHQLADEYLNRDEQTRVAFVHHPEYGRIYRTGDRARMTRNGKLEYLGRIAGGQVKLRGQRIELGEIEYAAAQTPGCTSAIVEVINGSIVAFCVASQPSLEAYYVRQTCRRWLPAFMVPTDIVPLERLPYLASGKVDRKALSKLHAEKQREANGPSEPSSPTAAKVAAVLTKVLQVDFDVSTDLASVGVDSLSAIRIASELRRAGFPQIDANTILEARNVEKLAERLEAVKDGGHRNPPDWTRLRVAAAEHPLVAPKYDELVDVFPSTPIQSAMLGETDRNTQAYWNTIRFEIRECPSIAHLEAAVHQLSNLHPLLRSGLLAMDQSPTGHVVTVWKALLPSQLVVTEDLDDSFSTLDRSDTLRLCHFNLNKTRLTLHIHHALYDQWSVDLLKADLSDILRGDTPKTAPSFRDVSMYYATATAASGSSEREIFWQDFLRDMAITPLPNLNGRVVQPALQRTSLHCTDLDLPGIRARTTELGCSLPSVFQTALACLLGYYCGSTDVMYGAAFSGRHIPVEDVEHIFGPCLTTLPCRTDTAAARTRRDLLQHVHHSNRALQRHATTSLVEVKRASSCAPDQALFDTLFVWQETSLIVDASSALVVELDSTDHHEFNLVLEFEPSDKGLSIHATYQERLLPHPQVQIMLRQLQSIATQLLAEPDGLVDSLSVGVEIGLLSVSNPVPSPCAEPRGILSAIESQAERRPDALALIFASTIEGGVAHTIELTYQELNARANILGRQLRSLGVSQGDTVCICMEKSVDLYVSSLATLKAGAGYLPLLPDIPPSRLRSVLNQKKIRLCLCDAGSLSPVRAAGDISVLDVTQPEVQQHSADNLGLPYYGSDICYTVFTSGSTGEPKGVAVTHDNLNGNLAALAELYPFAPGDRLLQACSHAFD
ncbi:hypothetical protein LTR53_006358, partial [Teratosphaeriaceae sp. CCFEE 6253]